MSSKNNSRYVPALDGLRAFAVLAVIAYHMKFNWAPGGLLGVTMFFVLSGYLITGLLLREYETSGTISLKGFWIRRVRRIIPAVVFAVLGIALLCSIFDHALLTKMRPDVIPTLLFVNNWWQILHNVSYFQALGEPSPLTHFWSLAIEEQFYLVWPLALLACLKAGVSKSTMTKGTIILAVLSAIEMALLFDPSQDPSRVYYGTDTRAFSLLIGSFLAFVWPYHKLTEKSGARMSMTGRTAFNLVGVTACVILIVLVALTNGFSPFIYRGGLLLCSIITAIAIAVMVHPISWIGKFFQLKPLVWIGKCSYSMYLWHYPIILLMTPNNLVGEAPLWLRAIQLVVIFAVSAFSYYVVENPIRHGAIGAFIKDVRSGKIVLGSWLGQHVIPVALTAVFFIAPIGGLALIPDTSSVKNTEVMQNDANEKKAKGPADTAKEAALAVAPYDILLIGDSVPESLDGYGVFYEVFPYGHIDALINRQLSECAGIYGTYADSGAVGDVVVIALGTNGYIDDADIDALMGRIGNDKNVWFVTTRSQTDFVEHNNDVLKRASERYPNVSIIDWYAISESLGEDVFDGDGTHLTPDGAAKYAQMIKDAVGSYLPEHKPGDKPRDEALVEAEQKQREYAESIRQTILDMFSKSD